MEGRRWVQRWGLGAGLGAVPAMLAAWLNTDCLLWRLPLIPTPPGYHEIFHTLVTVAALLHFVAVYRVVNGPLGAR